MSAALSIDSRPHSVLSSAVPARLPYRPRDLVTSTAVRTVSLPVADYLAAVAAGHRVVDIRSQEQRDTAGILSGALAVDASLVLDRLVPGSVHALRAAATDARWILVSADGHEAEWMAWHLQARGVTGALFLVGGCSALVERVRVDATVARLSAQQSEQALRDLAIISAH